RGGTVTIALHERDDPTHGGIVGLDAQERVTRVLEKPAPAEGFSRWVNAGIYVLEPEGLDQITARPAVEFGRDGFPAMLGAGGALYGYRMSRDERLWWIDRAEDLRRVEQEWRTIEPGLLERA